MKQYKNSKGEDLPKEINEVVNAENERLGSSNPEIKDSLKLWDAFYFAKSNYFKEDNSKNWFKVWNGDYLQFYLEYKFKNAKGQIFPDEIQNEIYEEIKRQGVCLGVIKLPFSFEDALKGSDYWLNIWESDYTNTELPTKSDDTFTQGETVEVSDYKEQWYKKEYVSTYKGLFITFDSKNNSVGYWKYCRKPILELTLPELLTIAESVKGTKVKLKS